MIKYLLAAIFFVGTIANGISQKKISGYEYIVVPTQYEFLKGKDTHRLNTLTRYVLRSYGFNALFQEELPPDTTRCDVLWLDAEGRSGFPWTRISVELKDCNGYLVFRTAEGKSKEKEYKLAYQESMRKALSSFEFYEEGESQEVVADAGEDTGAVSVGSGAAVAAETIVTPEEEKLLSNIDELRQVYVFQDYKLIATETDFTLVQGDKTIGRLVPTSQKNTYLVNSSEFSGVAYKTKNGFEIERSIEGQSDLMVMKFTKNED